MVKLMLTASILLLTILANVVRSQRPTLFLSACNGYTDEEIYYTGVCSIIYPYVAIGEIADYINEADNNWTVDYLIRNYLFNGIDKFFRETYADEINPINFVSRLDALIAEGLKLADKFLEPGCLTNQLVAVFMDPFYDSGFSDIRYLVITPFYALYPETISCAIGSVGGFCPRTLDILKVNYTYEVYNRTIDNLLRTYANNIFNIYNSPPNIAGKSAFDALVSKIEDVGTGQTLVNDVKAFTTSTFFSAIRDWYLNETDSYTTVKYSRTTTPRPTRPPLTTRESVIDAKAVNDIVLYLVPSLTVLIGIVLTVVVIAFIYSFNPAVLHVMQPIVNGTGAPMPPPHKIEVIQMEKMPPNPNQKY